MSVRILLAGPIVLGLMLGGAGQSYGAQMGLPGSLGESAKNEFIKGNYREAERQYRDAWKEAEAKGASATVRASILAGLAQTLVTQGRFAESEGLSNRALEITKQEVVDPRVRPTVLSNLAILYTDTYRYDRAQSVLKEALTLGTKPFGPESAFVAGTLKNLGIVQARAGQTKLAENTLKKALAIAEKQPELLQQHFAAILTSLSVTYALQKEWDKAESLLIRSVEIIERSAGPDHPGIADALNNLGEVYALQNKFEQAEAAFRQALSIRQKVFGPDNISVAIASSGLATVLTAQKKYLEANALFLSSLPIQERVHGPMAPEYAATLEKFAALLRKMEDSPQAETVETQAKNIRFALKYTVSAEQLKK